MPFFFQRTQPAWDICLTPPLYFSLLLYSSLFLFTTQSSYSFSFFFFFFHLLKNGSTWGTFKRLPHLSKTYFENRNYSSMKLLFKLNRILLDVWDDFMYVVKFRRRLNDAKFTKLECRMSYFLASNLYIKLRISQLRTSLLLVNFLLFVFIIKDHQTRITLL